MSSVALISNSIKITLFQNKINNICQYYNLLSSISKIWQIALLKKCSRTFSMWMMMQKLTIVPESESIMNLWDTINILTYRQEQLNMYMQIRIFRKLAITKRPSWKKAIGKRPLEKIIVFVQVFWEGRKNLKKSPLKFWH